MHALILAAGRGERMRPLTDATPKPLLKAGGRSLIEHRIDALRRAGIRDLVINYAHLGEQIVAALGDGSALGVRIHYSAEPEGALETGGGIVKALPLIASDPFLVVNGDIYCDLVFRTLPHAIDGLAHLVLVDNPAHNRHGDFRLAGAWVRPLGTASDPTYTFSGIGLYRHEFFSGRLPVCFPLGPMLRDAAARGLVTGQHHTGYWTDVGTPERLRALDRHLQSIA